MAMCPARRERRAAPLRAAVRRAQQGAGLFEQHAAGFGDAHAARQALQQGDAQFIFQPLQQAGERRLLDKQPLGGAGDVAFFHHGDERPQATQFDHSHTSKVF